ncbi:MAG: GNAT family protein [Micrococcaceae bacterium]
MLYEQWPVVLHHGPLVLRPLKRSDKNVWYTAREQNHDWLAKWEATSPFGDTIVRFPTIRRILEKEARNGKMLPFAMEVNSELIGQVTVADINYGSQCSGQIGYWISEEYAGQGLTALGVAMAIDYCFNQLQLHRIEIHVRPENIASLRIPEKLGMRREGYRKEFAHINGKWADHISFALINGENGPSVVDFLENTRKK